ncbi:MAG: sigma-54-dependent Fis family transcriptional regulator [Nitrospinae bacterium]|nr:sigma-54-dependent Fis family transcriptional regulator [Nitrospinota bacterium]MBF0634265.1 sigma-54-dependent Fis family transcriptional regulator [Nitrospinota bacterium]
MADNDKLVFVIDDDDAVRKSLGQSLVLAGYKVVEFASAQKALSSPLLTESFCFIVDMMMPGMTGMEFLEAVAGRKVMGQVVLITGHGDVPTAVSAMRKGAYDFIEKPFERNTALASVARAVEKTELLRQTDILKGEIKKTVYENWGLVGHSRAIATIREKIETYADTDVSVLISGETGTGKELVAHALHNMSARKRGKFVVVNIASLPETLTMGELFGYEKGAFTGAAGSREGKFEYAGGGTLLLDEINSASPSVQAGILRAVEEKAVTRLGSNKTIPVNIRILATTNEDLRMLAKDGKFRQDLFHRLNIVNIHIPPLRERPEDIPELAASFAAEAGKLYQLGEIGISETAIKKMLAYPWPGNVRELKNAIVSLAINHEGREIADWNPPDDQGETSLASPLRKKLGGAEMEFIEETLRQCGGNLKDAAERLNISPRSLFNKMRKYGIRKEDYKGPG